MPSGAIGPRLPGELPPMDAALSTMLHGVHADFLWAAHDMPHVSRRLLLEGAAARDAPQLPLDEELQLSSAEPQLLLDELQLSADAVALDAPVLRRPRLLSPEACAALRGAVDRERRTVADSIDGAPNHQLNLSRERLAELIGEAAVSALWELPLALGETKSGGAASDARAPPPPQVFVRRYTPETRPWTPWHVDRAAVTVNVALSEEGSCVGGELLTLTYTHAHPLMYGMCMACVWHVQVRGRRAAHPHRRRRARPPAR